MSYFGNFVSWFKTHSWVVGGIFGSMLVHGHTSGRTLSFVLGVATLTV
jgi:hypothetical protein